MLLGHIYDPIFSKAVGTYTVSPETRLKHLRVLGKTGTGKSTALINYALQDIYEGRGISFFDPHGTHAEQLLSYIPPFRRRDVIYFNPADREFPIGLNVLEKVPYDDRARIASAIVSAFKHIWKDSWGPQLEHILYNACLAILDIEAGTFLDLKFLLTHESYRTKILKDIRNPIVKDYWSHDFSEHMPEKEQRERTLSTLNKVGQFLSDPMLLNIIAQHRNKIDFDHIISSKKIFIANLSEGQIGQDKSRLLGSFLLAKFHSAALARTSFSPFYMYFDEFHNYGSASFVEMFSGIRKFGIGLIVAHQYLDQLDPALRSAVGGTVGTNLAFRIGAEDADKLCREFDRSVEQFVTLPPFHAFVKNGGSAVHLQMPPVEFRSYPDGEEGIIANSRNAYALERDDVEKRINRFLAEI